MFRENNSPSKQHEGLYIHKKGIVTNELYSPLRLLPFLRFILEISTVLRREILKNIRLQTVGKST